MDDRDIILNLKKKVRVLRKQVDELEECIKLYDERLAHAENLVETELKPRIRREENEYDSFIENHENWW